ncbi:MAG TPA: formyltransferase family protein [Candidatus Paceibacterota bacterium]
MGIVIITIPGKAKASFARALNDRTKGDVELVIVQKNRRYNLFERIRRLYNSVGIGKLPKELLYANILRFNHRLRNKLEYFRDTSFDDTSALSPRTIEVDSVNGAEVHELLKKLSPELLVVWGSTILEPHIVKSAKRAINLHMGYCPHYRGALANQHAVLRGDVEHVGATIHYVNGKPDAGDILEVIRADTSKHPRELLLDVNNRAFERFVDIAERLAAGENLPAVQQENDQSNVLLLREWVPSLRYRLGRKMLEWEKEKQREVAWRDAIAQDVSAYEVNTERIQN